MSKNVKLKSLLEGYAWERNPKDFGKPLPTLEDIQAAYQAKQDITEDSRMSGLLDRKIWKEVMSGVYDIAMDYQADGYEFEDIVEFIEDRMKKDLEDMLEGLPIRP